MKSLSSLTSHAALAAGVMFASSVLLSKPVKAELFSLQQTINNPTPDLSDQFGYSVAIDGNNILIGSYFDDTGATNAGSAYLFDTSGNLLQTINNPAPNDDDRFGYSVAIDGDNLLIGAWLNDLNYINTGSAYLYDTSGNLLQTIDNPTPSINEYFGRSVAIDGDNILIGADESNEYGTSWIAGSAYLFDTNGNLLQTINNPEPFDHDLFGWSVAIDGDNLLIGAYNDGYVTGAHDRGTAYLYDTNGNLLQTIDNPTPDAHDYFGNAVAIDGDNLLIGANYDDAVGSNSGIAYLFDTGGNLLQTINNPTPGISGFFGNSVAIDGDKLLIGAATGGGSAGSAHLFNLDGVLLQTFNSPTPILAIDGDNLLVGAYQDDTGATDAGSVYLYSTSATSVPGPLPLFGVYTAYGFSRKLRRRIQRGYKA